MAEGFLGRWSGRKLAVREGKVLEEPVQAPVARRMPVIASPLQPEAVDSDLAPVPQASLPSLQDVQGLSSESDFKPFVARGVAPEVRNAAMKKLFADPHYNVMDGLDIYIDDYSRPDPLPQAMLRQMASARFLKLFEDEESATTEPTTENQPQAPGADHDNTDLRLQPNHAAGRDEPGRSAE